MRPFWERLNTRVGGVVIELGAAEGEHRDEVVGVVVLDVEEGSADARLHGNVEMPWAVPGEDARVNHVLDHGHRAEPETVAGSLGIVVVVHVLAGAGRGVDLDGAEGIVGAVLHVAFPGPRMLP